MQPVTTIFILKPYIQKQFPFLETSRIYASRHMLGVEIYQTKNENELLWIVLLLQINPYSPKVPHVNPLIYLQNNSLTD